LRALHQFCLLLSKVCSSLSPSCNAGSGRLPKEHVVALGPISFPFICMVFPYSLVYRNVFHTCTLLGQFLFVANVDACLSSWWCLSSLGCWNVLSMCGWSTNYALLLALLSQLFSLMLVISVLCLLLFHIWEMHLWCFITLLVCSLCRSEPVSFFIK
jgi:hypothetical protein